MNLIDEVKIVAAVSLVGHPEPGHTPSEPIETLLKDFLNVGKLYEVAEAWVLLKKAKPANARHVADKFPGFLWGYWERHGLQIDYLAWKKHRPDWDGEIRAALTNPSMFVQVVTQMDNEIRTDYSKPMPG